MFAATVLKYCVYVSAKPIAALVKLFHLFVFPLFLSQVTMQCSVSTKQPVPSDQPGVYTCECVYCVIHLFMCVVLWVQACLAETSSHLLTMNLPQRLQYHCKFMLATLLPEKEKYYRHKVCNFVCM